MGLIERILEKVLSDHAGDFLKVNREQLAASLMRGEVVLTGVELRVEALKEMMKMLPFSIKSANVKVLKAKVPWNELRSKSVRIHASGIQIVLVPQSLDENSAGDSWADVLKRQRLVAAELLLNGMMEGEAEREAKKEGELASQLPQPPQQQQVADELEEELDAEDGASSLPSSSSAASSVTKKKSRMTLMQRVIARILDNLAITVEDVHIRYEDPNGFSLGLKLEEFSLFTVAENNEPAFVDRTTRPTPAALRRRIKIRGLAVYGEDHFKHRRRDLIRPFGIVVSVSQHLVANPTVQFSVEAKTEGRIVLSVGPDEYSDLAQVVERATAHDDFVTQTAILKRRPLTSPKVDPVGWWKFAIHAVVTALRQNRQDDDTASVFSQQPSKPATWPRVLSLIQQRWKYVLLYKRRLIHADSKFQARARKHSSHLTHLPRTSSDAEETSMTGAVPNLQKIGAMAMKGEIESQAEEQAANSMLRELEIELPFQSIMLFRAFAEAEFREERARLKKLHRSKKIPARAISAVVQGATTGRKMVLRSLGLMKNASAGPSAPVNQQPAPMSTIVEDDTSWTLTAKERQELYEAVAADPATAWMIAKTTLGTTATQKKIGFGPSFEGNVTISSMSLNLFSSQLDPIMEIKLADLRIKAENSGVVAATTSQGFASVVPLPKKNVTAPLWTVDLTLGSADLLDLRPEVAKAAANPNAALDHRYIPGGLKTATISSSSALNKPGSPLVQLQMGMTYHGGDRTKLRVFGEVRPTQLIVSLMLIERLIELPSRVQSLHSVAPTTLGRIRELGEKARSGMRSTLKQTLDVRVDWDTPSVCIPISIEQDGYARALEMDLGKFRVRSAAGDTQLDFEAHGVKSSIRLLEKTAETWVLVSDPASAAGAFSRQFKKQLDHPLLDKFNLEVRVQMMPLSVAVETTPISIRVDEHHLGAIGMAASDALDLLEKVGPNADAYKGLVIQATQSSLAVAKNNRLAVSLKVPKIDFHMAVPYRLHELRRRRPGWGDLSRTASGGDRPSHDDLLPDFGWLKLRLLSFVLVMPENSQVMDITFDSVHLRDDVQRAGEHFRDMFKIEGKTAIAVRGGRDVKVDIQEDVTFNWNPSTIDALGFFIKRTVLDPLRKRKIELLSTAANMIAAVSTPTGSMPSPTTGGRIPSSLSLDPSKTVIVSLPKTIRMFLNQETIGTRFGVIRLENMRVAVENDTKIEVKLRNMSMYGLQWEPLTSVKGVQLFGSELAEEDFRTDDLLSVQVDTRRKLVDLKVDRGRFLWAHTFTKQYADYFSDGIAAVVARHFGPPPAEDQDDRADRPPPKLEMLVTGSITETTLVCPALRFGENFRYSPEKTDEFVALVHDAQLEVSVFDKNERRNHLHGLFRDDDAAGCGRDATKTLNAYGAESDGLVQQDPVVEIRIVCGGLDLRSVKKQDPSRHNVAEICRGIKGKLAWHILDFTRAQRLARTLCSPLTAREQARMDYDKLTLGEFGIPYGEHPHGVSPQKFEMLVDIDPDTARFQMSPTDLHLMFLVIFENILDHRRRLARTAPPCLPLFESDEFRDWGEELSSGPDELVGGDFGQIAVKNSRFELLPTEMTEDQLAHDLQGFSGDGPPAIVDLDLSMKMPRFVVTLVTPETRRPFAELNCFGFEMSLSEFYDRTQFIEISVDHFSVTSAGQSRQVLLDIRPSSFLKNPATLRVRSEATYSDFRTDWKYERASKPLYVFVNKFPQKDRRVEIGLERIEVNLETRYLEKLLALSQEDEMVQSIRDEEDRRRLNLPGFAGGPHRVQRALALETFCNRFTIRAVSAPSKSVPPDQVLLKGCAHVIIAVNRSNAFRGQVQLTTGMALRALSDEDQAEDEGSLIEGKEELDSPRGTVPSLDPEDFERVFRFWLEDVYTRKNPVKLGEVDSILRAFSGAESDLIQSICSKYGEEPFDLAKFRKLQQARAATPAKKRFSLAQATPASPRAGTRAIPANHQYREVTIVEPFGVRLDINQDALKSDLVLLIEPIKGRLTNGHLEACRNVLMNNDLKAVTGPAVPPSASPPPAEGIQEAPPSSTTSRSANKKPISVTALLHGVEFNLINDYGSSHSFPLIRASLSGLALKMNQAPSGTMSMTVHVTAAVRPASDAEAGLPVARVDYFNPRLLAWEPLMEPWEFDLSIKDWSHIEFRSKRPLNLNLTYSFVESFAYWLACRSARSSGALLTGSSHSEHYIVNETGLPLLFWAHGNEQVSKKLESGQRAPLRFLGKAQRASSSALATPQKSGGATGHTQFFRDTREGLRVGEDEAANISKPTTAMFASPQLSLPSKSRNVLVSFRFLHRDAVDGDEEFGRLLKVPIDSFGTLVYALNRPTSKVTIHVSLEHGSKVVRVLSPVQFRNITSRPLTLLLSTPKHDQHWALGPVPNDKSTFPIPLDRLHCEFRYRPITPLSKSAFYSTAPHINDGVSRSELEAEAAGAISKTSDETGYGWSSSAVGLSELHQLVDHPVAMLCNRSKMYSRSDKRAPSSSSATFYEQEAGSFKGGGAGYQFATLLGVESFESSDELRLRETYVITVSPLLKVENRLPCPLLVRSIRREIMVNAGEPADLPVSGGKVVTGEDIDINHIGGTERRRSSLSTSKPSAPDSAEKLKQQTQQKPVKSSEGSTASASALTPSHVVARDIWLMMSVPGFAWSVPFQPTSQAFRQSVVVADPEQPSSFVRLMMDCEQLTTGCLRVTVFVESWFINDAKKLVALQYRESGVAGEQLIYDMGSRFKDRGGQAASLIYELGQNLKLKAMLRGGNANITPVGGKQEELHEGTLTAMSSSASAQVGEEEQKRPEGGLARIRRSSEASLGEDLDDEADFGLFSEGRSVCVRFLLGNALYWSPAVNLDTIGQHTDVLCPVELDEPSANSTVGAPQTAAAVSRKRSFTGLLGMSVRTAPSIFRRSRIVTFCPRFVFVNAMRRRGHKKTAPSSSPQRMNKGEASDHDDTVICFSSFANPSLSDSLGTCWVETTSAMLLFDPPSLTSSASAPDVAPKEQSNGGSSSAEEVTAKRVCPILRMAMRRNKEWWGWSGPFCCSDSGGEFSLKLRNQLSGHVCVVRVKFEERDASTIVFVEEESALFPLYRVISQTDEAVHYFQPLGGAASGNERGVVERLLTRGSSRVFGWDEPNAMNRVIRLGFRGDTYFYDVKIDELSAPHVVHLPSSRNRAGRSVWVSVRIRGITKTLLITDRPPPIRIRHVAPAQTSTTSMGHDRALTLTTAHEFVLQRRADDAEENEEATTGGGGMNGNAGAASTTEAVESLFSFRVELAQVGLSIIDRAPQELLYLSLTDVLVDYARTNPPQQRLVWQDEDEDGDELGEENALGENEFHDIQQQRVRRKSTTTGKLVKATPALGNKEGVDAFDLSVGRVQIDNQLSEAQFPVLLGPAKSWFAIDESVRPLMLRLSLVRRFPANAALQRFDFYEFASLQVYEMNLKVEDTLLLLLGRMAWECAMSLRSEEELVAGKVDSESEGAYARLQRWMGASVPFSSGGATSANSTGVVPSSSSTSTGARFSIKHWLAKRPTRSLEMLTANLDFHPGDTGDRRKVYFGLLHILPLNVNLSFRFTAHDPKALLSLSRFKTALALRGDQVGIGQPASFDAEYVAKSLPPALINIDNARIRLLPLMAPHILAEKKALAKTVVRHYSRQAITQVYRILGSSDLIGNPLGVVSDLRTGINDFISQPISGLAKASPTEFVRGLGRGTFSLLRHVTMGTFDALSKVTGALGAGVALLSLDHRFVADRWSTLRFEQPRTAGTGLALGLRALANSLYDGANGLVLRPLRSIAEEGSARAFARELGLGVVGVVVKPVVGLLDLTSRASNGVIASVQSFDPDTVVGWNRQAERVRLPRAFKGLERRLDPYLHEDAFVSHLIKLLEPIVHLSPAMTGAATSSSPGSAPAATLSEQQHFDYQTHVALDGPLFLVCAGQRLWCLDSTPLLRNPSGSKPPERVWDLPLNVVLNITASKEPEFPAVRIWIERPGTFTRAKKSSATNPALRGGAADAELVVLGGQVGETVTKAIVVFHVDSHLKAKAIARVMRTVIPAHGHHTQHPLGSPRSVASLSPRASMDESGTQPRRLGLALGPLPSQMKKLAGPAHVGGAGVVLRIIPDSPASRSGLKEGDIVVSCDGAPLDMDNPLLTLKRAATKSPPADIVLQVRRAPGGVLLRCVLGLD